MPMLNLDRLTDLRTRAYLYRVLLAVVLLAAVPYGVVTTQELDYWALVASTVLGTGTATYNTPRPHSRAERGRYPAGRTSASLGRLASERASLIAQGEELIRQGVDPEELLVPVVTLDGKAIHDALLKYQRERGL